MADPQEAPAGGIGAAMDALPDIDEFEIGEDDPSAEPAAAETVAEETEKVTEATSPAAGDDWMRRFAESRDVNVVPEALRPEFSNMLRKWQHSLTQMGRARAEYERRAEEMAKKITPPSAPAEEQPPPIDNSSQAAFEKSIDARQRWYAEREVRKLKEEFTGTQKQSQEQMEQLAMQADDARRTRWVESQPHYTPDVRTKMIELATQSPFWAQAYWNDEGLAQLYEKAASLVSNKEVATKDAQRRAGAPGRTVDSPRRPGVSKGAAEADKYAALKGKGIDAMIDAIGSDMEWP